MIRRVTHRFLLLVATLVVAPLTSLRAQTINVDYTLVDQVVTSDFDAATSTTTLQLRVFANATQAGVLSGIGKVAKTQSGTLILTGANTYTGGTDLMDGVLELGSAGALGPSGAIGLYGGTLRFTAANTTDYSARFDPTSVVHKFDTNGQNVAFASGLSGLSLTKLGGGTLTLTGAGTGFTQATISGGTLQIGDGGTTGSLALGTGNQFALAYGANLTFNRGDDVTLDETFGTMAGAGSFTKTGAGTLILTSAHFHTGGTTLAGGVLEVGALGALGSTGLIRFTGGTLRFGVDTALNDFSNRLSTGSDLSQQYRFDTNGLNVTFLNALTSPGGTLTKLGAGTLTLAADNSYIGGTTVAAGTLQIGQGNDAAGNIVGPVSVASGATLAFNRLGSYFLSPHTLANAGSLTFTGGATVTLSSAITGAGTLTLNSGTFNIADGGSVANAIDVVDLNNSSLVFNQNGLLVHSGVISGAGTVTKSGLGTVTFAADQTYTGQTTISAGTLQIGNGGATGSIAGDIVNFGTLVFNRTGTLTHAGVISGPGSVTKSGTGTVVLTGANGYSGGTTVAAGTLELGSAGAISSSGTISLTGGILRFSAANTTDYSGRLSTAPGQQYRFDTNGQDVTFSTALASSGGSLAKSGAGTLTLTGANTFSGGATITGGTLQVGNGFSASIGSGNIAVASGATLAFNRPGDWQHTGLITGGGTLQKLGSGALTLLADNTVGATVSSGTLRIGDGGTTGFVGGNIAIASGATVELNRSNNVTYSGALSGAGAFTKAGAGTLTLLGNSALTGGATVSSGTLQIGDVVEFTNDTTTGSFAGDILLQGGANLVIFRHENYTQAGAITGGGAVTVKGYNGPGVITLTGNNSYTGGTTIDGRTLVLGSASALGSSGSIAFTNGGTLRHTAANTTDYSARFSPVEYQSINIDTNGQNVTYASGFGDASAGFTKLGTGTLTLAGANTFGSINVSAGTLALGSSAAAGGAHSVYLESGATLDVTAAGLTLAGGRSLGGAGTVVGAVTLGESGQLNPYGALTLAGGLDLGGGASLNFALGAGTPLVVENFLTGPASGTVTVNFYDAGGFAANTWTLIDFTGVTPTGLSASDFTLGYTVEGFDYSLAIVGSTLALTATSAIPEPSTYAVLGGLAALGLALFRRRPAGRNFGAS